MVVKGRLGHVLRLLLHFLLQGVHWAIGIIVGLQHRDSCVVLSAKEVFHSHPIHYEVFRWRHERGTFTSCAPWQVGFLCFLATDTGGICPSGRAE